MVNSKSKGKEQLAPQKELQADKDTVWKGRALPASEHRAQVR